MLQQLLSTPGEEVSVSVITEAELRTGAAKSARPVKTLHLVENFLRPLTLIDFTSDDAIAYAGVRAKLERAGTPIGALDTNNEREFRRVPGLTIATLIASQAVARKLTLVTNWKRGGSSPRSEHCGPIPPAASSQ